MLSERRREEIDNVHRLNMGPLTKDIFQANVPGHAQSESESFFWTPQAVFSGGPALVFNNKLNTRRQ